MIDLPRVQAVAERIGFPPEAAVAVVLILAARKHALDGDQKLLPQYLSAGELCDRLLGSETAEGWGTMRPLRFLTSEDVGRLVYALAGDGLIGSRVGESEADLAGLFDLRSAEPAPRAGPQLPPPAGQQP